MSLIVIVGVGQAGGQADQIPVLYQPKDEAFAFDGQMAAGIVELY